MTLSLAAPSPFQNIEPRLTAANKSPRSAASSWGSQLSSALRSFTAAFRLPPATIGDVHRAYKTDTAGSLSYRQAQAHCDFKYKLILQQDRKMETVGGDFKQSEFKTIPFHQRNRHCAENPMTSLAQRNALQFVKLFKFRGSSAPVPVERALKQLGPLDAVLVNEIAFQKQSADTDRGK